MAKREKKRKNRGSSGLNRKNGEDFLDTNKLKPNVQLTESGLQYEVIEQKDGAIPSLDSKLVMHQRILLLNGTLLEDTYKSNEPTRVYLNELIEGLQEGLQLMPTGSRFRFWVPSELAWGKKGSTGKIPPYAVLNFDIRLLELE